MTRRYPQTPSTHPPNSTVGSYARTTFAHEPATHVLKLPKSGGCVDRDAPYLRALRARQICAYFFGDPARCALSPHTQIVDNAAAAAAAGAGAGNRLEVLRMVDRMSSLFSVKRAGRDLEEGLVC